MAKQQDSEAEAPSAPRPGRDEARKRQMAERRERRRQERRNAQSSREARIADADPMDDDEEPEEAITLPAVASPDILPATAPDPATVPPPPPEQDAPAAIREIAPQPRRRRRLPWLLILSFLLMVAAPAGWLVHYLWWKAADEYHSVVAFSVRSEEPTPTAIPDLASLGMKGITGALDSVILSEFIESQQIVEKLDTDLSLRTIYNRKPEDWLFSFGENRSIEDLVEHWAFMTDVDYDHVTSLIRVQTYAFTPEDARRIADGVLAESTKLINSLSAQAREDAIRFARRDLDEAEARLREVRLQLRQFRDRTQTADPTRDVEVQMGVILALQQALAEALIDRAELLDFTTRTDDARVAEAERKITAIESQIAAEKLRLGSGAETGEGGALSLQIGEFEELKTELGFAEQQYLAAQAAYDLARIEARRQSRYLAVHIEPTLAQESLYPQREFLAFLGFGACFGIWGVLATLAYNLRDRR